MVKHVELLFYEKFILVKEMRTRLQSPFVNIKCDGVADNDVVELYVNGKKAKSYHIINGFLSLPVEKNKQYRIASQKFPYGFRFNTTDPRDNTDDILLFHTVNTDSAELKNIYRIIEHLCSIIQAQQIQITSLTGYQTE